MNKELKEQAHKEFDEKFGTLRFRGVANGAIKSFIDSLIDKTVQKTKERIVGVIENMDKPPEEEKFTEDKFQNTENMNRVFMRVGYRKALEDIISLITNKSDNNTK